MESLTLANNPLEYECYNDVVQNYTLGGPYPDVDQCFEANPCVPDAIIAMGIPSHLERSTAGQVEHADKINFVCTDGKFLKPESDINGDNMFSVDCDNGAPVGYEFPTEDQCQAKCTTITVGAGFQAPATIDYMEDEFIEVACTDPTHYVSADSWVKKTFAIKCLDTALFDVPATWPICDVRPECGFPQAAGPGTGLEPETPANNTAAGEYTTYKCTDPLMVTDHGRTIDIQCRHDGAPTDAQYYNFPNVWGAASMQCREPVICPEVPSVPLYSGLIPSDPPASGYSEFNSVNYTCEDPTLLMYMGDMVMNPMVFEVMCIPPGAFETGLDWPHCDIANPPQCDQYIAVPDGVPISIVAETPVYPGGTVSYRCDDPAMTTSLGMEAKASGFFWN